MLIIDDVPKNHNTNSTFARAESSDEYKSATFGKSSKAATTERQKIVKVSKIDGLFDTQI